MTDDTVLDFFLNNLTPAQVTRLEQIIRVPARAAELAERAHELRVARQELAR